MLARTLFLKGLERLREGYLEIIEAGERSLRFGDPVSTLRATVTVHRPEFFRRAVFGGDEGIGDSYVDGDWSSPDLVSLVRLAVRNLNRLRRKSAVVSTLSRVASRLSHLSRPNTIEGSRRNIAAHYDLSNEFFRLFLDQEMVYSSAVFTSPVETLEDAQTRKLDHICAKLGLKPSDHVLEIGTGWGAFAEYAARVYGCRVTTTTISAQQHELAARRFRDSSARERIELLFEDYRRLTGSYDRIVSIEMFEAVGLRHYDAFFSACNRLLRKGGSMLIQTITMNERSFPAYQKGSDWIRRRIFPGGELASVSEMLRSVGRSAGLTLLHAEDIGFSYALTLREWRRRFLAARTKVLGLGFDERFVRMWDYYLAYCEGAFLERYIGDAQMIFTSIHNADPLPGEPASNGV